MTVPTVTLNSVTGNSEQFLLDALISAYIMDLVAGYESDTSGSSGSQNVPAEPASSVRTIPALPSWASATQNEQPAGLLDDLPAPSSQPKGRKRRTLPMTLQYVPDSDEEVDLC